MFRFAVAGLLVWAMAVQAQAPSSSPQAGRSWQRVVSILQYLEQDYPGALASGDAFELEEQKQFIQEALLAAQELGAAGSTFLPRLQSLKARIDKSVDGPGVVKDSGALIESLVVAGGLARSPKTPPKIAQGQALFAVSCAACHGADGKAQVEIAAQMEPKPRSFVDPEVMDDLTPYKIYNTLTFGVPGTAMPAFPTLSDEERWSLAFSVVALRYPPCARQKGEELGPRVSLEELANAADAQLRERFSAADVGCLRQNPPAADREGQVLKARAGIEHALQFFNQGDFAAARAAVLDAYLDGIEPIEPQLRTSEPGLIRELEAAFLRARLAAEKHSPQFQEDAHRLLSLLDRTRRSAESKADAWAVFWMACLILLREGFEATIVIAALLAVLKKMEQTQHAKVVHAGWISAIAFGALTYVLGRHLVQGADRERVEGITALVAVGMLLYAALWLNARANIRKFMGELRQKVQGALGRQNLMGLFAISFMAMFRESFETALFVQGLAADSPYAAAWGALAGIVALLFLVGVLRRLGVVLPMQSLFRASTVLLVTMAVILLGKGIHALQEVGVLPIHPMAFIQVDWLGIYPDAVSLVPQLLLAVSPLIYVAWSKGKRTGGAISAPHSTSPRSGP